MIISIRGDVTCGIIGLCFVVSCEDIVASNLEAIGFYLKYWCNQQL